jgi:Fe-S oxidoreductase
MAGRLDESGLGDDGVFQVLDLCLECRACKAECPVGVDMARFKSEFLADYWNRHGTSREARILGNTHVLARHGSRVPWLANQVAGLSAARWAAERFFGIDRRRALPRLSRRRFSLDASDPSPDVLLFSDTFTNYFNPEVGLAAVEVLRAAGFHVGLAANTCCGRTLISKGLLAKAREQAARNTETLIGDVERGRKIAFCEPSCLSAVREDAPSLLRGDAQRKAQRVAEACLLFDQLAEKVALNLKPGPNRILLHGHCHQKAMGLLPVSKALLARIPGTTVVDPDAGCCGMAGSFGYSKDHFDISRAIGERKLFPAVRSTGAGTVVVASGFSCRHQIHDFTGEEAVHPAVLLRSLL